MRDDFPKTVLESLAKRVGNRCSNQGCGKLTSGPHTEDNKSLNVGVAAHITAASSGGPRYDTSLSSDERKSIVNGIWLCQSCAKLVDNDKERYTAALLAEWKTSAEQRALKEIESPRPFHARQDSFSIATHIGTVESVNTTHCVRHGRPMAPAWLRSSPSRMCSEWLAERLMNNADLQLFFDPKWCDGIWFVADLQSGDGVVINLQQLADLMPPSPTTTTTPESTVKSEVND